MKKVRMRRKKKRKEMIGWTNARINSREKWLIRWNSMSRAGTREEKGKKTREKERWGKMLKFPWKGSEWKGKRRGWTWIGGQGIWFPWNCVYWRMFDGIRLHMKVYGITWMNVLLPVKLSPWLRGKGDRVGHLPIKRFIPVTGRWTVSMGNELSPCVRGQRRLGVIPAHKAPNPRGWPKLSPWARTVSMSRVG